MSVGRGSLPTGWKEIQLGKVAQLSGRIGWKGLTAKEYTSKGPLFLSVHSLNYGDYVDFRDAFHITQARYNESPEIMLRTGDVLICKDGAGIGKLGIVGELPFEATINSSLLLVRAQENILPKYLYYILSSPYFQDIVRSRLMGATTPHLYQRDIAEFPIYLPPTAEQRHIVAILDEALAGLAVAAVNAEKNIKNVRELFESYLNSTFVNQVEGDWKNFAIQELTEPDSSITYGVVKPGSEGDVVFIRGGDISHGRILTEQLRTISQSVSQQYRRTLLKGGELLISLVGQPGQVAIAPPELAGANIARQVGLVRLRTDVDAKFVSYFLRSYSGQKSLGAYKGGSVQQVINLADLRLVQIPLTSLVLQRQIVATLDKLADEVLLLSKNFRAKRSHFIELKKSILKKAFSGELTSPPSQALTEAAE